jgi:hypothetical protein
MPASSFGKNARRLASPAAAGTCDSALSVARIESRRPITVQDTSFIAPLLLYGEAIPGRAAMPNILPLTRSGRRWSSGIVKLTVRAATQSD